MIATPTYPPVDNGEARVPPVPPECEGCDGAFGGRGEPLTPHLIQFADGTKSVAHYCVDCSWVAMHSEVRDPQFKYVWIIQ